MKQADVGQRGGCPGRCTKRACAWSPAYPGTPSTEITEAGQHLGRGLLPSGRPMRRWPARWPSAPSIGGARAILLHEACGRQCGGRPAVHRVLYRRARRPCASVVADDPGMHSSQNEQDSRHYAIAARTCPMLEPCRQRRSACDYVQMRLSNSPRNTTRPCCCAPVTRVAHAQSI